MRTPKTKRVRADYVAFQSAPATKFDDEGLMAPEDARAEFDRWLAKRDADKWDEGYKAGSVDGYYQTREEKNPYRIEPSDV